MGNNTIIQDDTKNACTVQAHILRIEKGERARVNGSPWLPGPAAIKLMHGDNCQIDTIQRVRADKINTLERNLLGIAIIVALSSIATIIAINHGAA